MKSPFGRLENGVGPHYQHLLATLIRQEKPDIVVETGLETGYGAEWILQALDENSKGHLYSIDPLPHVQFTENPIAHPRFTFIKKFSVEALDPLFKEVGPFDIFVHDSDHSEECQTMEFDRAWEMVRPGGIICCDDCFWGMPPHFTWDKFLARHNITDRNIIGNAQWIRKP